MNHYRRLFIYIIVLLSIATNTLFAQDYSTQEIVTTYDAKTKMKHSYVKDYLSNSINTLEKKNNSPIFNKETMIMGVGITTAVVANKLHENAIVENSLDQEVLEQRIDPQTYQTLDQIEIQDIQSSEEPFDSTAKAQEIIDKKFPHLVSPQIQNDSTNNVSYDNGLPDSINEYLSQFESQGYENDMGRDID